MGAPAALAARPRPSPAPPSAEGLWRAAPSAARRRLTPRLARAGAFLLLRHHLGDQSEDLVDAGRLRVAVLEGGAPVLDSAVRGELVEVRARDLEPHLRVGGDVLRDSRTRQ